MENEPGTTGEADEQAEEEAGEGDVVFVVPPSVHLGAPSESLFARFPLSTAS